MRASGSPDLALIGRRRQMIQSAWFSVRGRDGADDCFFGNVKMACAGQPVGESRGKDGVGRSGPLMSCGLVFSGYPQRADALIIISAS